MKSFLKQKNDRILKKKEIEFIRNLRWNEMRNKLKN